MARGWVPLFSEVEMRERDAVKEDNQEYLKMWVPGVEWQQRKKQRTELDVVS